MLFRPRTISNAPDINHTSAAHTFVGTRCCEVETRTIDSGTAQISRGTQYGYSTTALTRYTPGVFRWHRRFARACGTAFPPTSSQPHFPDRDCCLPSNKCDHTRLQWSIQQSECTIPTQYRSLCRHHTRPLCRGRGNFKWHLNYRALF